MAWQGRELTAASTGQISSAWLGSAQLGFFNFCFCFGFCCVGKEIIASSCFLFELGFNTLQRVEEVADCLRQSPASRDQ